MNKILENYGETWNLVVKVMVVRKEGKIGTNDKWWLKGERIEVVNNCLYLGVKLTSSLSWNTHLTGKARVAKLAMNSGQNKCLNNSRVPTAGKIIC